MISDEEHEKSKDEQYRAWAIISAVLGCLILLSALYVFVVGLVEYL